MAVPTNTEQTFTQVGIREDLTDVISRISPEDTPFLTMAGNGKADNTFHEWQTDALRSSADNKHVEGDDTTATAVTPTVRLGNYTQIFKESAQIAGTTEAVNRAGRAREMAYQILKKTKELNLDRERACIGISNARVAGNASTAREFAAVNSWITTNTSHGTGGSAAAGTGADVPTDGTQRAFTEALLTSVLESCYTEGAKPSQLFAGVFNRSAISGFSGNADNINREQTDKKVINSVTVYEGDYHTLTVVPSREIRSRDVLVLDPAMWKMATLRNYKQTPLAKTGDSEKRQIVGEETLVCMNPKGNGFVADLTTS